MTASCASREGSLVADGNALAPVLEPSSSTTHVEMTCKSRIADIRGYISRKQHRLEKRQAFYDSMENSDAVGLALKSTDVATTVLYHEPLDVRDVPFTSCDDLAAYM